jgi:VWFA-related protein
MKFKSCLLNLSPWRWSLACALLLAPSIALPQDKPDAVPDSGAVIRSETRVVLVDTIVMDKKGSYVHNLTAKDFKVWEDNKEQTIKTFNVQSGPGSPGSSQQRRYIVLFFDNSTLDLALQAQARQAAAKFIDANAAPNRMMSIVNYGGALQIAQNFTADADRLKHVVAGEKFSAVSSNVDAGAQISRAAASFGARDMLLSLRNLAKDLNAVPGRKTLILFTAGFPLNTERISEATATIDVCNRSNVAIYPIDVRGLVSGAPVAGIQNAPGSSSPGSLLHAASAAFGFAPSLLSRVSFSPAPVSTGMSFFQRGGAAPGGGGGGTGGGGVGAGGRTSGGGAPTAGAPSAGRGGATAPAAPAPTSGAGRAGVPATNPNSPYGNMSPLGPQSQARSVLLPKMPESVIDAQNIMHMLADGTGGFVIKNTNDLFAGLQKIGLEMDEYYILGYTPPESAEGSCHALRVKVDKGGAEVRARTGYCNARARDLLAGNPVEKTLESRASGSQPGTVPASIQLPYFYTASNVARVNVAMEIPSEVMKFEKQKGKFHAQIDILGIAYNQDGSAAARFSDTLKRDFDDKKEAEAFEKAPPLHYENQFDIGPGRYTFKVVFGAGANSNFGKIEAPLNIDPWDSATFGVSALALSKQVRKQSDVAQTLDESLLDDRVPLLTAGMQVIPAGSTRFAKTVPPLFYAEVYEPLFIDTDVKEKPGVGIQIRILDRKTGEQRFSTGFMRLDNADIHGPVMSLGERVPVESLTPGQYVVELQAIDSANRQAKRTADFDLE